MQAPYTTKGHVDMAPQYVVLSSGISTEGLFAVKETEGEAIQRDSRGGSKEDASARARRLLGLGGLLAAT